MRALYFKQSSHRHESGALVDTPQEHDTESVTRQVTCVSCRFEARTKILLTFVIGHSEEPQAEEGVQIESEDHGGFMRLPVQVC